MSSNCRGQTTPRELEQSYLDLIILLSNLPGFTKSLCPLVNLLYGIYIGTTVEPPIKDTIEITSKRRTRFNLPKWRLSYSSNIFLTYNLSTKEPENNESQTCPLFRGSCPAVGTNWDESIDDGYFKCL